MLTRLLHRQDESLRGPPHVTQQASIHHHQYTPLRYRKKSPMSRNYIHQIQIRIRIPIQQLTPDLQLSTVWRAELRRDQPQRVNRDTHQAGVLKKEVQVELRKSPRRTSLPHDWFGSLFELLTAATFRLCHDRISLLVNTIYDLKLWDGEETKAHMETNWAALGGTDACYLASRASFPIFSRWTFGLALMALLASARRCLYIFLCTLSVYSTRHESFKLLQWIGTL